VCLVLKYYPPTYLSRSGPQTAALRRKSTSGLLLIGYFKGIDATTLEANAALRSIVRRDIKEGYQELLKKLGKGPGIASPSLSGQRVS